MIGWMLEPSDGTALQAQECTTVTVGGVITGATALFMLAGALTLAKPLLAR